MEVWLRGLKRHTANVLNRHVYEAAGRGFESLPHHKLLHGVTVSTSDSGSGGGGSNPSGATKRELWQTWCMRRTENPENVVRLHEVPQEDSPMV